MPAQSFGSTLRANVLNTGISSLIRPHTTSILIWIQTDYTIKIMIFLKESFEKVNRQQKSMQNSQYANSYSWKNHLTLTVPPKICSRFHVNCLSLTLFFMETPFDAFANRAAWSGSTLFAYGNMIKYDPTLVYRTHNFFVLYVPTWKFIDIIIHSGWRLAWIFMRKGLKQGQCLKCIICSSKL